MSLLISCQSISKSFGTHQLFHDLSLSIFSKDRIGLIGLNGSGKSTLIKILAGLETPDSGTVSMRKGLKIGYLPQSCEFDDRSPKAILLETLRTRSDIPEDEWEVVAEMGLSQLDFTGQEPSAALLSGGWKKRLGLAQELILSPDLFLLDEPTNHLDLEGVLWLEKFLHRQAITYLLISHDRTFLQNVTSRVVELDLLYSKGIFIVDGSYFDFLEKKKAFIEGQIQQERSMATKMRRETAWLRQGVKARTTKSQARIDQAHQIIEEHSQIRTRNRKNTAQIDFVATERQTRKLLSAKNISKELGGNLLFQHLDLTLSPGSRIGLMGPNGSGKTTLLRILAGELTVDQGTIKLAENLKVVYFDQHRVQLPLHLTLKEALSPNGDYVIFRDHPVHINGWCKRFLFSPDILELPIGQLSGGERARISIARLILQPADLLLLDEPTNDLDIPTLETLEESLLDFPGAVVLIAHDRCMLERTCTSLLALGDPNNTAFYVDYGQWESAQKRMAISQPSKEKKEKPSAPKSTLTYLEKKEFATIEGEICKREEELGVLNLRLEDPEIANRPQSLSEICRKIGLKQIEIEKLYLRWHELDTKSK